MAEEKKAQSEEQPTNRQAQEEAERDGAYEGESNTAFAENEGAPLEDEANELSPAEEAERQIAEYHPRSHQVQVFDGHEELEGARHGAASTHRALLGRVVVVDEDVLHDGELYKAGVQDLPLEVADALIEEGLAFEPAGKKMGR